MSITLFQQIAEQRRFGKGISKSAKRRRDDSRRLGGTLHSGKPGDVLTMSRGRKYLVAKDGSFRRVA